ncbi:MAG: VOC family protein [Dactylosporangium sp.]|nr:VOC family protein [Dactylosporangium sp.]
MGSRWFSVIIDAADPARLARWWAEVLDYRIVFEGRNTISISGGTPPSLSFVGVTEPKAGKNRLHIDLNPDDQEAEVERLVNMGARRVDIGQGDVPWVVLADPEGNEFCVLTARDQGDQA